MPYNIRVLKNSFLKELAKLFVFFYATEQCTMYMLQSERVEPEFSVKSGNTVMDCRYCNGLPLVSWTAVTVMDCRYCNIMPFLQVSTSGKYYADQLTVRSSSRSQLVVKKSSTKCAEKIQHLSTVYEAAQEKLNITTE